MNFWPPNGQPLIKAAEENVFLAWKFMNSSSLEIFASLKQSIFYLYKKFFLDCHICGLLFIHCVAVQNAI